MKKIILNVQGMHCNSCKLLLEKSLSTLSSVEDVYVSVKQGTVNITYNETVSDSEEIKAVIRECGYEVGEKKVDRSRFSKDIKDYKIMIMSFIGFFLLYLVFSYTGIINFDIKTTTSPSLSIVLLIGLTAGFSSCMAVLGGLVLAVSAQANNVGENKSFAKKILPHVRFNIGRVIGFAFMGGLLGLFGSMINLSPFMMSVMTLIVGVVMMLLGVNLTKISPKLSAFSISLPTGNFFGSSKRAGPFGSGVLSFFLPCGFTFAMQLYAMSTGSFWMGMGIMVIFAIGTLPGLIGVGSITSLFNGKTAKIAYQSIGVLVILLGLYNVSNSYSVVKTRVANTNTSQVQQTNTLQHIDMRYTDDGLSPSVLSLDAGKTYQITIDVQTTVFGCMSTIYLPGLDEHIQSVKKGTKIVFTVNATNSGEYEFDCAMGISHGAKIIIQ